MQPCGTVSRRLPQRSTHAVLRLPEVAPGGRAWGGGVATRTRGSQATWHKAGSHRARSVTVCGRCGGYRWPQASGQQRSSLGTQAPAGWLRRADGVRLGHPVPGATRLRFSVPGTLRTWATSNRCGDRCGTGGWGEDQGLSQLPLCAAPGVPVNSTAGPPRPREPR